jgi:hypothetical protein
MATVADALVTRLLGDASLAGYVGTRVFPLGDGGHTQLPLGAYRRVSRDRVDHMAGKCDLVDQVYDFVWVGEHLQQAQAIADLAEARLDRFGGTVDVDGEDVVIEQCFLKDDRDEPDEPELGETYGVFRVVQRWRVWSRAA